MIDTSAETRELLDDIADEMSSAFSIPRPEAVARINEHWGDLDLSSGDDLVLHEDAYYWALWIYFGGAVPDWSPQADRTAWVPRAVPPRGSGHWPAEARADG